MTTKGVDRSLAARAAAVALDVDTALLGEVIEALVGASDARSAHRIIEQRTSGSVSRRLREVFEGRDDAREAVIAIDAAARAVALVQAELGRTTTVWTGPSVASLPVRPIRQTVLQLIARARRCLTLVTYAGYDIEELVAALEQARKDYGVAVRLILETSADSGGRVTVDPAVAFGNLPKAVAVYRWPASSRGPSGGSMHVKTVIRDSEDILVSSANLTGAAMDHNMELGLLVEGGRIAGIVDRHFDELIEAEVLVRVQR